MSVYEHARNTFAVIGLLFTSGVIGLISWHVIVAVRRFRANRTVRANERAKAKAPAETPSHELDEIGYESLGVHREV
jgi:hypothetical protein